VAATEQRLEVHLGGVPFRGVVDRVERAADGLVVTDYKSGRLPPPAYRADKLEQVLLYAAAVAAAGEEPPGRARLLYLGAEVIDVETSASTTRAAVDRLRARWDEVQECVAGDRFPARAGPLCAWCPYVGRCPEGEREVGRRSAAGLVPPDAPARRLVA
jgi:putative RecB family exonuclease